jgi:hypothetical protein
MRVRRVASSSRIITCKTLSLSGGVGISLAARD